MEENSCQHMQFTVRYRVEGDRAHTGADGEYRA